MNLRNISILFHHVVLTWLCLIGILSLPNGAPAENMSFEARTALEKRGWKVEDNIQKGSSRSRIID
jgi:hypothetical protein